MIVGSVATMTGGISPPSNPPVADFDYTPTDPDSGSPVQFYDLSTKSPTSWSWKVNDVEFSTQQNPSYYFNNPGSYTVKLTATNSFGSSDHIETVFVNHPG